MARHVKDSATPVRRSTAGWMPAKTVRLSAGVGRRHPSRTSQGVVDSRVIGEGVSAAAPHRSAVLCC